MAAQGGKWAEKMSVSKEDLCFYALTKFNNLKPNKIQ
jgi:hypothetical protein